MDGIKKVLTAVWNALRNPNEKNDFVRDLNKYVTPVDQHLAEALRALQDQNKEIEVLKSNTHAKDSIVRLEKHQKTVKKHILELQSTNENLKQLIKSFADEPMSEDRNKAAEKKLKTTGYITKTAAITIYGKKLQKSFSLNPAVVYVQFLMPDKEEQMSSLQHELEGKLSSRFKQQKQKLDTNIVEDFGNVNPNHPLLILCISVSRLGTDVETALQGSNLSKNQVLIVFHHKDSHALPKVPSKLRLTPNNPAYNNLGGIFDMACLSGKGIYPCDMNDKAVGELVNFISTMSESRKLQGELKPAISSTSLD